MAKKRVGGVAEGVGPEFKLQYCKNIKKDTQTVKVSPFQLRICCLREPAPR
jgi:hypothetical protein